MRRPCTKKDAPAKQRGIWRNIFTSSRMRKKLRLDSYWSKGNAGTHFEKSIRSRFRSINAHDGQKELSSDELDTLRRSSNPYCGTYSQWRSAYKRGSTSVCSRPRSIRDIAISRRNACCSIAWKTLRRPRIFSWVCQRSITTVDQRREDICMQNGQLRTSCCSIGYPPVLGAIRRQHRHRRICLQQVQFKSEVTN